MSETEQPGAGDWVICTAREQYGLRQRFPEAEVIVINEKALHGRRLAGRSFITFLARTQDWQLYDRVRSMIRNSMARADADPALRHLE